MILCYGIILHCQHIIIFYCIIIQYIIRRSSTWIASTRPRRDSRSDPGKNSEEAYSGGITCLTVHLYDTCFLQKWRMM